MTCCYVNSYLRYTRWGNDGELFFTPYCHYYCMKQPPKNVLRKRKSRFGDIFKGQFPNLEDMNFYQKLMKRRNRKNRRRGKYGKAGLEGQEGDGDDNLECICDFSARGKNKEGVEEKNMLGVGGDGKEVGGKGKKINVSDKGSNTDADGGMGDGKRNVGRVPSGVVNKNEYRGASRTSGGWGEGDRGVTPSKYEATTGGLDRAPWNSSNVANVGQGGLIGGERTGYGTGITSAGGYAAGDGFAGGVGGGTGGWLGAATTGWPGAVTGGWPGGVAGSTPGGWSGGAPGVWSGGAPGGWSGGAPRGWSGGAPGGVPGRWSGGGPGGWSAGVPGGWSGGVPGSYPAGTTGGWTGGVSGRVPGGFHGGIAGGTPCGWPESGQGRMRDGDVCMPCGNNRGYIGLHGAMGPSGLAGEGSNIYGPCSRNVCLPNQMRPCTLPCSPTSGNPKLSESKVNEGVCPNDSQCMSRPISTCPPQNTGSIQQPLTCPPSNYLHNQAGMSLPQTGYQNYPQYQNTQLNGYAQFQQQFAPVQQSPPLPRQYSLQMYGGMQGVPNTPQFNSQYYGTYQTHLQTPHYCPMSMRNSFTQQYNPYVPNMQDVYGHYGRIPVFGNMLGSPNSIYSNISRSSAGHATAPPATFAHYMQDMADAQCARWATSFSTNHLIKCKTCGQVII